MRDAGTRPSVPVILVTDQRALFVARLDDEHAVRPENDERNDVVADVAWRVARHDDVVGGKTLSQVRRSALGEACARTVGERRERRAESPHLSLPPLGGGCSSPRRPATSRPVVLPLSYLR